MKEIVVDARGARRGVTSALCGLLVGLLVPATAFAVCRVVEPVSGSDDPGVEFDPETTVLYVGAPNQVVDWHCASVRRNAVTDDPPRVDLGPAWGQIPPAGLGGIPVAPDAGAPDDGGAADGGAASDPFAPPTCADGTEATAVRDTLTSVVLRPAVFARGGTAGLVMPLPSRADVHVASDGVIEAAKALEQNPVVETVDYQEDPSLGHQCSDPHYHSYSSATDVLGVPLALFGCGMSEGGPYYRPGLDHSGTDVWSSDAGTVQYEHIPTTDAYDVTVLSASSLDALTAWLDDNGFAHGTVDDDAFAAYVKEGAWFVALKVHPPDQGGAHMNLAPLVVTWRGDTIPILNRLQYDPRGGTTITDAYVMAPTSMHVADGDGEVLYSAHASFADPALAPFGMTDGILTHIQITRLVQEEKDDTTLVPEATSEDIRHEVSRHTIVRIPAPCCPDGSIPTPEAMRTFTRTYHYLEGEPSPAETSFFTSPPPDASACPATAGGSYASGGGGYGAGGYGACSVQQGATAALSWAPLALVLALVTRRRRRRPRRKSRRADREP